MKLWDVKKKNCPQIDEAQNSQPPHLCIICNIYNDLMDLERIKKRNALFDRGAKLIEQARKLDVEGNYGDALPTYSEAIETLFQTLQCAYQ